MGISLKPEHLKRYKDVAWLLVKYGRFDLLKHAGLEDILTDRAPISTEVVPEANSRLSRPCHHLFPRSSRWRFCADVGHPLLR